jgi:HlyD family secretion protein
VKKILILSALVLLGGGGGTWYYLTHANGHPQYRLGKVSRGDLQVTVTATGTISPFVQVQVGTQVTGVIQKLLVDYNSQVKAGQLVALIDPAPFQSIVDQNKANLAKSDSDVGRVKASLVQAEKELNRSKELAKKELISASDLDAAIATYDSLVAQLKVADAAVDQAKAMLAASEVNLQYCRIMSPIDGIVIARSVDVGQTLSASLSAPTIYVIADQMKTIQIQASVAEADIGRVAVDQNVEFTVDAHREVTFKGKVSQIRLSPTTVQNVVTYTVMIDAENKDGKLLPGMTANVTFEIAEYKDILKVPNAALRFTPPGETASEGMTAKAPEGGGGARDGSAKSGDPRNADAKTASGPPGDPHKHPAGAGGRAKKGQGRVWIEGPTGTAEAVLLSLGATDGSYTQVLKSSLEEGQAIILGIVVEGMDSNMSNPFSPRMGNTPRR